ncbi:MAG: hypothetical protein AAB558_03975 [Patescibacteria group bacterium]
MLDQKGQTVLIDFFFASIVFLIVFFAVQAQWTQDLEAAKEKSVSQEMQLKAYAIAETLVKTTGEPDNWETLAISSVERIGLAQSTLSLDTQKVNAFKNLDQNYSAVKEILRAGQYDYFFQLDGTTDVNAGLAPPTDATKIVIRRIVEFEGSEAVVLFTLYKIP